jgi:hypothetical protein
LNKADEEVEREKVLEESINQKVLQNQAGLTMIERVVSLNANFPRMCLSTYKFYKYFRA